MAIFRWNPIRPRVNETTSDTDKSIVPTTFIPKNYVRERKHRLYNNLLILLGGLWALNVSHDMDVFDTENRFKFKDVISTSGYFLGHFVAVPLIIWKANLHYSIMLGAIGMGVAPFFYYINNYTVLSVAIYLRINFVALFDVSAMIYMVKLARICSKIQGNAVFAEVLTMHSFIAIFSCTGNIVSSAWRRYTREPDTIENDRPCGPSYCPRKSSNVTRLIGTMSFGQTTIHASVTIVIALSGIILITMYLKPITSLGSLSISAEPRASSPFRIMKQFKKPKAIHLAILITSCAFMYGMTDEFIVAYVTCSFSIEYSFFIDSMKHFSLMFGVMTCATLVDFTGFRWLFAIGLLGHVASYVWLVLWEPSIFKTELSYLIVYHVLCTSIGIEMSVLHLLVVQTLGDEEVSAWCFYYIVGDVTYLLRTVANVDFCTGIKLWILIGITPFTIIAIITYWYRFDDNLANVSIYESCSLLIKTPKRTLDKSVSFDLKIVIERAENIRKVETFLQRKYTLKSRFLVPPPQEVFSETF